MITLTDWQISRATRCSMTYASIWTEPLNDAMQEFGIDTRKRQAAFLAQIGHESTNLTRQRESLNYTPNALIATFGHRFTISQAQRLGRTNAHPADQKAIANIAYANRLGNGAPTSGDGWKFRGGGPGGLTFRDNYTACGDFIGIDLASNSELITVPLTGARSFGWFWMRGNRTGKSLNPYADCGDIPGMTDIINGGDNGLADRQARYITACTALGVSP